MAFLHALMLLIPRHHSLEASHIAELIAWKQEEERIRGVQGRGNVRRSAHPDGQAAVNSKTFIFPNGFMTFS